jgi:hypothetical protein
MRKSHQFIVSAIFLNAVIACTPHSPTPCLSSQPAKYDPDLTTVNVSVQTIVPYADYDENRHIIFDVFMLGRYASDSTKALHLFCREVDSSTGKAFDVDLGCVEGVLSEGTLYVWQNDPHGGEAATSHYPVRSVTNTPRGPASPSIKRVLVNGSGKGTDGVHVGDQS